VATALYVLRLCMLYTKATTMFVVVTVEIVVVEIVVVVEVVVVGVVVAGDNSDRFLPLAI
jgi:hypothetical protein